MDTFNGYVEIPVGTTGSTFRKATTDEYERAKLIFVATDRCEHPIFIDEPGFIYDIRSCHICGSIIGFI